MAESILDLIDESGKIIGSAPRSQIHREGWLHAEVNVFFYTPHGEIILQRRSPTKDTCPNMLDSTVGGHVEQGDDIYTAALKETWEETGVGLNASDLVLIASPITRTIDPITGSNNYAKRSLFIYKFEGELADLKIEPGQGAGFEAYQIDLMLNTPPELSMQAIPWLLDDAIRLIYLSCLK